MKSRTWAFKAKMAAQPLRSTTRPSSLRKSLKPDSLGSPFTNYVVMASVPQFPHIYNMRIKIVLTT